MGMKNHYIENLEWGIAGGQKAIIINNLLTNLEEWEEKVIINVLQLLYCVFICISQKSNPLNLDENNEEQEEIEKATLSTNKTSTRTKLNDHEWQVAGRVYDAIASYYFAKSEDKKEEEDNDDDEDDEDAKEQFLCLLLIKSKGPYIPALIKKIMLFIYRLTYCTTFSPTNLVYQLGYPIAIYQTRGKLTIYVTKIRQGENKTNIEMIKIGSANDMDNSESKMMAFAGEGESGKGGDYAKHVEKKRSQKWWYYENPDPEPKRADLGQLLRRRLPNGFKVPWDSDLYGDLQSFRIRIFLDRK
ncbi:hypothetical protein BDC45DRAFT_539839 [Circinella umbellata]|nr:hypothetical protein BDC45DRAFT_539839 [Circinella umbellata]